MGKYVTGSPAVIKDRKSCTVEFWDEFCINSLAPGRCKSYLKSMIFKFIIQNRNKDTCCEIAVVWMPHNLTIKKSTMVQIMAWCYEATRTSHYLGHCWVTSMLILTSLGHNEFIAVESHYDNSVTFLQYSHNDTLALPSWVSWGYCYEFKIWFLLSFAIVPLYTKLF